MKPFFSVCWQVVGTLGVVLGSMVFLAGQSQAGPPAAVPTSTPASAAWKTYQVDAAHTQVTFEIAHLGLSKVKGSFQVESGHFEWKAQGLELQKGQVRLLIGSIHTGDAKRDEHLKSAEFFDASKFPDMTFSFLSEATAKPLACPQGKEVTLSGQLSLHGVTRPVSLQLTYQGQVKDPWGNERLVFSAKGQLNRKDFGLTWNKTLDQGGLLIGDTVQLSLEGEATLRP